MDTDNKLHFIDGTGADTVLNFKGYTVSYQQLPLVGSYNKFGPLDADHRDLFKNVFPVAQYFCASTGDHYNITWSIDSNGYLHWQAGSGIAIDKAGAYLIN